MNDALNPDVDVRPAALADVPELARLFTELGYSIDADMLAQRFVTYDQAGEVALVAEQRGRDTLERRLVGLATLHTTPVLHRSGPVGRVTALVVDTTARGKGIGRTLVA